MSGSEALSKLSAAASKRLGIPDGISFASPFPFAGMNQTDSRTALEDPEFFWIENLILLGRARLRSLWDVGTALYTAPQGKTIVYFAWFNIGPVYYAVVFLSDGTAVQVQQSNGAVTPISSNVNTFYRGGQLPYGCQSSAQYLLIANNNTVNDYWIWDGAILYSPGSIAPFQADQLTAGGLGYTSVPSYTVHGGAGSGVVLTPVISEGSVVSLTVDNPGTGFLPGDIVQVAFSGGGTDTTPILEAVLGPQTLGSLELVAGGTGYTNGTFALGISGGGGSGAAGTFTVTGGIVTAVNLTNGGSGYTSTPTITFPGAGSGSGAVAVPVIDGSTVLSITIVNGGTNLSGTPTLAIVGGGGINATAVCTVTAGVITAVTMTNGGSGYTSTPAVEVESGLNNAASAILNLMPFGVSGTCIETFQSRVWLSDPDSNSTPISSETFLVSAPASLTDFATSDGGLLFTNSDRFLRAGYVAMHQSNGYLYPIGDCSVDIISNVQTSGSPISTTFNYQNISAQTGATWRDTVQDFGQGILFANANGVHGLYGGAVTRVSGKINRIFETAFQRNQQTGVVTLLPGAVIPSAAVTNLFTIPVYFMLMTGIDPNTFRQRNFLIGWDEKNWIAASQSTDLIFIATQEQNSVMTAWGTDGNTLTPLFTSPSAAITKTLVTKLYGGEREMIERNTRTMYYRATDLSVAQQGVSFNAVLEGTGHNTQIGVYPPAPPEYTAQNPTNPNFLAPPGTAPTWGGQASNTPGTAIGATVTSTSPDFELSGLSIAYEETAIQFG